MVIVDEPNEIVIETILTFNGRNVSMYLSDPVYLKHAMVMFCEWGLNQTNLPTAYGNIEFDVHITKEKL